MSHIMPDRVADLNRDHVTLSALVDHSVAPRILDIHLDDCEDDACTGCDPEHLAEKATVPVNARDALEAYMAHESDEDAAEFGRRLDAYTAEWQVRAEKAEAEVKRMRAAVLAEANELSVAVSRIDRIHAPATYRATAAARLAEAGESRG